MNYYHKDFREQWRCDAQTSREENSAASDKIIAVVGMKGTEALAAMGLQALPIDP